MIAVKTGRCVFIIYLTLQINFRVRTAISVSQNCASSLDTRSRCQKKSVKSCKARELLLLYKSTRVLSRISLL